MDVSHNPANMPILPDSLELRPLPNGPEAYGRHEIMLGIATNRSLRDPYYDRASPTMVRYSSESTMVRIDLENDPELVEFLRKVQVATGAEYASDLLRAEAITGQVVARTTVDQDRTFHVSRDVTLGYALCHPVECIDRALAMEAGLKMGGFADAAILSSMDRHDGRERDEGHADVTFTIDGEPYAGITMGDFAGRVVPIKLYQEVIIPLRRSEGLGTRELEP